MAKKSDQSARQSRLTDPGNDKGYGKGNSSENRQGNGSENRQGNGKGSGLRGALIIFVKNAEPGHVKTRLAADLGEKETMEVYMRLVAHTMEQAAGARTMAEPFVYFSREIPARWPDVKRDGMPVARSGMDLFKDASVRVQQGRDLGQRMKRAFQEVYSAGYDRAVIIGSDCPELDTSYLEQAFSALESHDAVAGPAIDGGYYLLGMRTLHPGVFDNKPWSTDSVFERTLQDFKQAGLRTYLLPELRDLDTIGDYRQMEPLLKRMARGHPGARQREHQDHLQAGNTGQESPPFVSMIIPVYNEEDGLASFLHALQSVLSLEKVSYEIIMVDGGSTDRTVAVAGGAGIRCVVSPRKGRAAQMNYGAGLTRGKILYFLHADTLPPPGALSKIKKATGKGTRSGCFRLSFDEPSRLMRFYAWFTRFDLLPFRYGDQSLFVNASLFERMGGFREDHAVMEDNEFFRRLRKEGSFVVLEDRVVTSARKYRENGFLRLQLIFTLIFVMYYLGFRQETLVSVYRRLIARSKL
ncbi:MAG: TIGR04283 family arsenosugar biosynthesis glycosyltransferase [Cyclonatronaceae bacterium]